MVVVRGSSNTYNKWADLGSSGWDYDSVLPYFKKFEGNQNADLVANANGRYHNADGPVKVDFGGLSPLIEAFISALKDAGVEFISDINTDREKLGHVVLQAYAFNGRLSSTAEAYLSPVKNRPNLHVMKHSYVEKILIDSKNAAYGVELTYRGKHSMRAYSKREVIVSAGAIQSVPLLMRSGIGPTKQLNTLNISCKADLAVGDNLISHIAVYLVFGLKISTSSVGISSFLEGIHQYRAHKTGLFGASSYLCAFLNTKNVNGYFNATMDGSPDIQNSYSIFPRGTPKAATKLLNRITGIDEISDIAANTLQQSDVLVLNMALVNPKSRGVVRLNLRSKCQDSIVYTNFLEDTRDRNRLVTAIKQQIMLMESFALRKIGTKFIRPSLSECDTLEYRTDSYWECYIKYFSTDNSHQHGTSKMGTDPKAVVDPRLNVYQVTRLRQIDMGM